MSEYYGLPDNTERSYKCARCGNMFEAQPHLASTCPICGFSCSENLCNQVDASNEGY